LSLAQGSFVVFVFWGGFAHIELVWFEVALRFLCLLVDYLLLNEFDFYGFISPKKRFSHNKRCSFAYFF